ncbi:MAG: hypothetical protein SGILL_009721, partial [Bacillariaceae sp.]
MPPSTVATAIGIFGLMILLVFGLAGIGGFFWYLDRRRKEKEEEDIDSNKAPSSVVEVTSNMEEDPSSSSNVMREVDETAMAAWIESADADCEEDTSLDDDIESMKSTMSYSMRTRPSQPPSWREPEAHADCPESHSGNVRDDDVLSADEEKTWYDVPVDSVKPLPQLNNRSTSSTSVNVWCSNFNNTNIGVKDKKSSDNADEYPEWP